MSDEWNYTVVGNAGGETLYRCNFCDYTDFGDGMATEGGYCCEEQDKAHGLDTPRGMSFRLVDNDD